MKILIFASSKGGAGKTTLAAAIAVEAATKHSVAILDLDPQQSLAYWHDTRGAPETDCGPALLEASNDLAVDIAGARKEKFDYLIIDTAAAPLTLAIPAIENADLVVIPTRASPLDVESIGATIALCDRSGRNRLIVLNAVGKEQAMTAGARGFLSARYGGVTDVGIAHRDSYAAAMLRGDTAPELQPEGEAAREIGVLWQSIQLALSQRLHHPTRNQNSAS